MDFWTRPSQFGFVLPQLGASETPSFFSGTNCRRISGGVLLRNLLGQCQNLQSSRYGSLRKPCLAAILPGENPASRVYVAHKQKRFEEAGFVSVLHSVPTELCTVGRLADLIDQLNEDPNVDGILLQLPLPAGLDPTPLLDRIRPDKDVDGFHVANAGVLTSARYDEGLLPCTPFGMMALLRAYGTELEGKSLTVVGRSNIVGKPMAILALNARATVSVVHKATADIRPYTQLADVLVVAAGSHHLITPEHVRPGAVVIDVGMHRTPSGALEGDVHPAVCSKAAGLTPVPGGVGPMTIGMLCVNTAMACWTKFSNTL